MTRVVVVADSGPVLASLTAAVETVPGAYIVRHGSSAGRLDRLVAPARPRPRRDRRPARPGGRARAPRRGAQRRPEAKVVVLSSSPEASWLADALRAQASAVLPGGLEPHTLGVVLREVLAARAVVVATRPLRTPRSPAGAAA